MAYEDVALIANGKKFTGWKSVEMDAALNEACRAAEISVSEIPQPGHEMVTDSAFFADWHFPPNTPIQITANGTLMMDGYVDDYDVEGDRITHGVTIRMRGKGADFVDSSVTHPTGQFENMKVEDIAKALDAGGVGIRTLTDTGAQVPSFRASKGSSRHAELLRLCQQRKLVMKGAADGQIELTKAGLSRHAGGLILGINLTRVQGTISARARFADYIVDGQSAASWEDPQISGAHGVAHDKTVTRARQKVIVDNAESNAALARQRAEWEQARAAGNSAKAELTTPSWRDDAGALWEPGFQVFCRVPWLRLEQDMVIEKVKFAQTDAGTLAHISLVDPRSYNGNDPAGSNSSPMWDPGSRSQAAIDALQQKAYGGNR
jgi:prophage tail gpP-like protein